MTELNRNKKYIKPLLIFGGVLLLALAIYFYNQKLMKAYYLNAKFNNFKTGDNVYMVNYLISDMLTLKFQLMRLVKSDNTADYRWVASGSSIVDDSLERYRTSLIGRYLKVEILNLTLKDKKVMARIYAIEPNWKVVNKNDTIPGIPPPGYSFADSNYYLNWALVSSKPAQFKK